MSTRRINRFLFMGLALLLVLAPLSTVSAQPPIRGPYTFVPFTIEGQCDFPVYWEISAVKGKITTYFTANRDFTVVTGQGRSTMTNEISGKSVEFLIEGKMEWFSQEDGSFVMRMRGPHINFFNFLPGLTYVKGDQEAEFDPEGNLVRVKTTGKVTDICAVLGD